MGRALVAVLALAGCLDPGPTMFPPAIPPPGPTPGWQPYPGGLPPGGIVGPPATPPPPPEQTCRLLTPRPYDLCRPAAPCPVRASWQIDCDVVQRFDLAVSPDGQVLAVVDALRSSFVLEARVDQEPALTHIGYRGLEAAFTRQVPPEPRLFSYLGAFRRTDAGWQPDGQRFVTSALVVGVGFTQGEAGFAVLATESDGVRVLWLNGLPPSQEPAVMIAQGTIDYEQLLITPSTRQPVVVYAQRRGGEIAIREWTRQGSRDLQKLEPKSLEVGFAAAVSADDRAVVQYNHDGNALLVGGAAPVPVFAAEAVKEPVCNRCGNDDEAFFRYNESDIGERVSHLHALAGNGSLWTALITGKAEVFCQARGCANNVAYGLTPGILRLRNVASPARELAFERQWRDPIVLAADDHGLLYLAWKDFGHVYLQVIDPAAF